MSKYTTVRAYEKRKVNLDKYNLKYESAEVYFEVAIELDEGNTADLTHAMSEAQKRLADQIGDWERSLANRYMVE